MYPLAEEMPGGMLTIFAFYVADETLIEFADYLSALGRRATSTGDSSLASLSLTPSPEMFALNSLNL